MDGKSCTGTTNNHLPCREGGSNDGYMVSCSGLADALFVVVVVGRYLSLWAGQVSSWLDSSSSSSVLCKITIHNHHHNNNNTNLTAVSLPTTSQAHKPTSSPPAAT